jgi:hypothetical protein
MSAREAGRIFVGWLYVCAALFSIAGGLSSLLAVWVFAGSIGGDPLTRGAPALALSGAFLGLALGSVQLWIGVALGRSRPWALPAARAFAMVALALFPFGTLLGAAALWALQSPPETSAEMALRSRRERRALLGLALLAATAAAITAYLALPLAYVLIALALALLAVLAASARRRLWGRRIAAASECLVIRRLGTLGSRFSVLDVARATGLGLDATERILTRLAARGHLVMDEPSSITIPKACTHAAPAPVGFGSPSVR